MKAGAKNLYRRVWLGLRWILVAGLLTGFVGTFSGCSDNARSNPSQPAIQVYAAASMADVLTELGALYSTRTGHELRFNFANSGILARQIELGAPADLFISADSATVKRLESRAPGLIVATHPLVTNRLVAITRSDSELPAQVATETCFAQRLPGFRRIAIGTPGLVPAGTYAESFFCAAGIQDAVKNKLLPLDSVHAVVSAVISGNATVGFVYATDALRDPRIAVWYECPAHKIPMMDYPLVLLTGGGQSAGALAFAEFLQSNEAKQLFSRHGFIPTTGFDGSDDLAVR